MQDEYYLIGETAGKIYKALLASGETTSAKLQKAVGMKDTALFNQALGWLAREDKISMKWTGRTVKLSLLSQDSY
ncbi:MAG: hypothetical protein FGM27_06390 [Candidatus Omnitrophica bacterium]|nr:hypothetical protein [Candidatus Omnitrophota bacterium]